MRRHFGHGALAGLAGGAALALVLLTIGEGPIGQAVGLERRAGSSGHDEMFSRGTQQVGGAVAALVYGLALGLVFAVAYACLRRRLAPGDDWRASLRLAAIAFATVFFVPFLKYPPNPPAVGSPDTIGRRTALYLVILGWSVVATWAAWLASRALGARSRRAEGGRDAPRRGEIAGPAALYILLVGVGLAVLPGSPDPVNAPATLVWNFRLASLAGSAAFWAVTGAVFGWLTVVRSPRRVEERALAVTGVR